MGDNLLTTLGHAPAFGVKANPLGWLEDIASKWVPAAALLRCVTRDALAVCQCCPAGLLETCPPTAEFCGRCLAIPCFPFPSRASDVKINLHQAGGMSKAGAMKVRQAHWRRLGL